MKIPWKVILSLTLLAAITIILSVLLIAVVDPSFFPGIWHSINFGKNPLGGYYP